MQIEDYIIHLLNNHECVVVPGFGGFLKTLGKSGYNADIHQFSPPRVRISFNAKLIDNDGLLLHYIAQQEKKSYTQVQDELNKYVHFIKTSMRAHETVLLPKIGLFFGTHDRIQFQGFELERTQNINASFFGLPDITVRKREEIPSVFDVHKTASSNSFWRYAASILLLLNIGLLISLNTPLRYKIEEASIALFSSESHEKYIPRTSESSAHHAVKELSELTEELIDAHVITHYDYTKVIKSESLPIAHPYKIIVGCFRDEENAKNLILSKTLNSYSSFYFLHNGLYKVCVYSTLSDVQAHEQLEHIKQDTHLQAWILKSAI